MPEITVIKLNLERQETWRYFGQVQARQPGSLILEAFFNRPDLPFHGILLKEGDRFIEGYYENRWYNVFEIHDREDGSLKGWYCNVAYPAEIDGSTIRYVDLALDLLVYPDGRQMVLDEDEFADLRLDPATRAQARLALAELIALGAEGCAALIHQGEPPAMT
jgi:uncharacterized protein